jgi:hypothetical protein
MESEMIEFERELRRVYNEIDKFSHLYLPIKDEYDCVRVKLGEKRLRHQLDDASR